MEGLRNEFLAGAGLAENQHGAIGNSDAPNERAQRAHGRRFAGQDVECIALYGTFTGIGSQTAPPRDPYASNTLSLMSIVSIHFG